MKWWFRQQLYCQIFIGIALGIGLGLVLGEKVTVIRALGEIFIRLLMMLIVPLTFLTVVNGITKLDNVKSIRSLGASTLGYYAFSSVLAGSAGMGIALLLQPGKGVDIDLSEHAQTELEAFSFIDNLVHWIPTNPIEAFAEANMLQIIVFAIIVGIALLSMGQRGERLVALTGDGAALMIRITEGVMKLAPYGILALVANMVASLGYDMLWEVGRLILTQYLALSFLLVLWYPVLIRYVGKLNPRRFYRNIAPAMLVASSTTSSAATLPVSMTVAKEKLGASEKVWGFTLPLGATVNMDGMAACIGCIAVFSSNLYQLPVTPGRMFQFMFVGLALSIGTAGVKGAGIVMSTILLQTIGVPTVIIIPILTSIWPLLDIGNTCCNVTGDLVGTTVIASRSGMLDKTTFEQDKELA